MKNYSYQKLPDHYRAEGTGKMNFTFTKIEYKSFLNRNWPPIICFIVTFLWFGIFACIGIDLAHDGVMLKPAIDVASGQVLFRDTFTQYGALTTFIQAMAIKMFGPYLIVIRLTTVLFYSLSALLLYYIWRNFLSPAFFWIIYGLFLVLAPFYGLIFLPWSSIYALFFMLLANLFMINFIRRASVWLLWGAGVSSALAFWCRQPSGIVMYLALFLYFSVCLVLEPKNWKRILNNFGICTAGYMICCLLILVYLALNDALTDWYFQSIRFMFAFGIEGEGRHAASLFSCLFPSSVFIIFPIAALSALCVCLYSLFMKKREGERSIELMLIVTAIIGLGSWHQYFPVPCVRHFYWAAIPMLGFYAFAVQTVVNLSVAKTPLNLFKKWTRLSKLLLTVMLLLPFYGTATRMVKDATDKLTSIKWCMVFHDSFLKNMIISNTAYRYFHDIQSVIERIPPEIAKRPGLNLAYFGTYALCLPNGDNLFPMYVNWGKRVYPNYFDQVNHALAEKRPMVITDKILEFPGYSLFAVIKNMKPPLLFYLPDERQKREPESQPPAGTGMRK